MPALMGSGHTDAEVTNMRRVIAKRLQASKMEVPHYYLTVDVEMDKVMSLRKEINTSYEKEGVKVSVNDFIIKATALACRQVKTYTYSNFNVLVHKWSLPPMKNLCPN